jgi:imidazolonepropionase-like amidohydrolase
LVLDGKIAEVGVKVAAPKTKVRVIEGKGLHVYPGMIDSGTPIGLSEIASVRETVDVGELGEFNPQLHAIIAVNPESAAIPVTRANGITGAVVLPAPVPGGGGGRGGDGGTIIGGQASLMHLAGWTWEEMEARSGVAMQLVWPRIAGGSGRGGNAESLQAIAGRRPAFSEARRTQEQQVQKINEFIEQARRYKQAKAAGSPGLKTDLKMAAMLAVIDGKMPLLVVAAREREIREAVAWAEKQQVKIVVAGVREPGRMAEEMGKKKIPVVLGSTYTTPANEDDPYDEPYTLPGRLHAAGVKFAFASFGTQFARNLPYEAGQAVPYGLPYDEALKAVTLNAAEIWGVADAYGSIDRGKLADLIVTTGDPLEIRTQVKMEFVKGEAVDLESKHTSLYKKYSGRP